MITFPQAFLNNMKEILKDDFPAFLNSLTLPEHKAIFVNNNKISTDEFKKVADFPIESVPYEKSGFYIDNDKYGRHPLHHAGAFYIQEPSAMFTVNSTNFVGDERVLDMCASPGGKSIQLANRVPNGLVVSNEIVPARAKVLYSNLERMGLKNVIVCCDSPQNVANTYANFFDVVLVDAPCSGEGMFRRGQEVVDSWNFNLPNLCAKRQLEILNEADKALKQGGKLIYSTCTYEYVENEGVIQNFLKTHNYKLLDIPYNFKRGIDLKQAVRLYPHQTKGEGQFVCVMEKLDKNELNPQNSIKLSSSKVADDFLKKVMADPPHTYLYKDNIFYILDPSSIKKGVNYLSVGVKLGKLEKDRFAPDHYLFSAFGNQFYNQLNLTLDDNRLAKYLKGEEIETEFDDGFGVVKVCSCPLGGFKISAGRFKNYYPKGLRNLKI